MFQLKFRLSVYFRNNVRIRRENKEKLNNETEIANFEILSEALAEILIAIEPHFI